MGCLGLWQRMTASERRKWFDHVGAASAPVRTPRGGRRMTKRLDPDIKAMRAINRALTELPDDAAVQRVLDWTVARATRNRITRLPRGLDWRGKRPVEHLEGQP